MTVVCPADGIAYALEGASSSKEEQSSTGYIESRISDAVSLRLLGYRLIVYAAVTAENINAALRNPGRRVMPASWITIPNGDLNTVVIPFKRGDEE